MALQLHSDTVSHVGAGQHFEQQQQHGPGPIRSRSSTPRAGGPVRAPNGRTSSPELSDFLDAASVALYSVPYLRERLVNLQVSVTDRGALVAGLICADDVPLVCWRMFTAFGHMLLAVQPLLHLAIEKRAATAFFEHSPFFKGSLLWTGSVGAFP